jgi:hypothetical protein
MITRFLHHVAVERPSGSETATDARERLGAKFPRNAARRMTHLGMLLGATLDGVGISPDDAIVYATSYAETRALEDFLTSFPTASPLLFQTSIHPGGVQQVMIGRQQPARRLWPLAGRAHLVEQGFLTSLLETADRVLFLGGEEKGTWLLEHHLASERAFAFALELTREPAGAAGRIELEPDAPPAAPAVPMLAELADALAERRALAWTGCHGAWTLAWS